jgi:hypothetical protein
MTLPEILTVVRTAGIQLEARGERLHVEAPPGTVTPALRAALVTHKVELLAVLSPSRSFVALKGGLTVPAEALRLAFDLEARGVPLRTDADHQLVVPVDPQLTEADHATIRRWQQHLGAIVDYPAPEVG